MVIRVAAKEIIQWTCEKKTGIHFTQESSPCHVLEVSDFGYLAWGASRTTPATNADIKSSLGIGIVRFTEKPEEPQIDASAQIKTVVNNVVFPAIDLILAVFSLQNLAWRTLIIESKASLNGQHQPFYLLVWCLP